MTTASASEYAESIANEIQSRVESGDMFGFTDNYNGGTFDSYEEAISQGVEPENIEEATAWDYLSDVLDVQYTVNNRKEYLSARILIAFGGPTAWINTGSGQVEAAWWSETVYKNLPREFCEELDSALEEMWSC